MFPPPAAYVAATRSLITRAGLTILAVHPIGGVATLIPFHLHLPSNPDFLAGEFRTPGWNRTCS